jgi:hypothetical protein
MSGKTETPQPLQSYGPLEKLNFQEQLNRDTITVSLTKETTR